MTHQSDDDEAGRVYVTKVMRGLEKVFPNMTLLLIGVPDDVDVQDQNFYVSNTEPSEAIPILETILDRLKATDEQAGHRLQ